MADNTAATLTDERGVYLEVVNIHTAKPSILYDVWISKERQNSDLGWLGFIEIADEGYTASHWTLPTQKLGPYPKLEDATLILITWNQILAEQGYWDEEDE